MDTSFRKPWRSSATQARRCAWTKAETAGPVRAFTFRVFLGHVITSRIGRADRKLGEPRRACAPVPGARLRHANPAVHEPERITASERLQMGPWEEVGTCLRARALCLKEKNAACRRGEELFLFGLRQDGQAGWCWRWSRHSPHTHLGDQEPTTSKAYHRRVWVGRDLEDHLVPTPLPWGVGTRLPLEHLPLES